MFRKVRMVRENDEWVMELAGHEIPLVAVKSALTAMFIVLLIYWTYAIGHSDSIINECNLKIAEANRKIMACNNPGSAVIPDLGNLSNQSGFGPLG